jgi:hypothetical protein
MPQATFQPIPEPEVLTGTDDPELLVTFIFNSLITIVGAWMPSSKSIVSVAILLFVAWQLLRCVARMSKGKKKKKHSRHYD